MIYFIQEKDSQNVKIGKANDVEKRLKTIQTNTSSELVLLMQMHGNEKEESILHKRFKDSHIRNEWFYFSDAIQTYIKKHKKDYVYSFLPYEDDLKHLTKNNGRNTCKDLATTRYINIKADIKKYLPGLKLTSRIVRYCNQTQTHVNITFKDEVNDFGVIKDVLKKYITIDSNHYTEYITKFQRDYGVVSCINFYYKDKEIYSTKCFHSFYSTRKSHYGGYKVEPEDYVGIYKDYDGSYYCLYIYNEQYTGCGFFKNLKDAERFQSIVDNLIFYSCKYS